MCLYKVVSRLLDQWKIKKEKNIFRGQGFHLEKTSKQSEIEMWNCFKVIT